MITSHENRELCNRFCGTFLHNARMRQTTDEMLLMPICVITDTLLPLKNGHFLETDAFLNALTHMVAQQGWPKLMLSDNGSNYRKDSCISRTRV